MKRSSSVVLTMATAFGLLAMANCPALAQTTAFDDNFANDASDPTGSYVNLNNIGSTLSSDWTWANGTGVTLTAHKSGAVDELVGAFTSVTLANAGDYVSLVVNFNSPNIGQASSSGSLDMALMNSLGTPLGTGYIKSNTSGGATGSDEGYLAGIGMDSAHEKNSTKFWTRDAGAGGNGLGYYSQTTYHTQIGTSDKTAAALANSDSYTLTFTIAALNAGATEMQVNAQIYDNTLGAMVDNYTIPATFQTGGASTRSPAPNVGDYITPTSTFDTFDFGTYTGSTSPYDINLTDVQIVAYVTTVPEPSTFALAGLGLAGLAARLFRRH